MRNLPFGWEFLIFSFLLKSNFLLFTFHFSLKMSYLCNLLIDKTK